MPILDALQVVPADRIAVRVDDLAISFGRLLADVAAAAAMLAAKGVGEGSKVAIRAGSLVNGHSYANWVAHLAAIRLGAAHASIAERSAIAAALQAGMIDTVIGPKGGLRDMPASLTRIEFDCDPAQPLVAPSDAVPNRESAAVRLNLTSGTTGTPKFVSWNSAMIAARVAQLGTAGVTGGLPIGPDAILYPLLHLRTTAGFRYPLAVWQAGGCVLLPASAETAERDEAALGRSTLIAASPMQLAERLRLFPDPWDGLADRTIIVLGGRLPIAVRDAALGTACAKLMIGYGSTETGSIALGESDVIDRHPGAVGFVRDSIAVEIVDAARAPVASGESGLVRIKADLMSAGYDGVVPGEQSSHFDGGYFYPGDIGRLMPDGMLAIEGRVGDTFNVGGWKINAPDLEAKLAFMPGVDDLCACVLALAEGDLLTIAVRIRSIPRNAMGKIPRAMIANKLTELYGASRKNLPHAKA